MDLNFAFKHSFDTCSAVIKGIRNMQGIITNQTEDILFGKRYSLMRFGEGSPGTIYNTRCNI